MTSEQAKGRGELSNKIGGPDLSMRPNDDGSPADADELLLVGVVVKAHALKGELVVLAFNPGSPVWSRGSELLLLSPDPTGARPLEGQARESRGDRVSEKPLMRLVLKQARPTPDERLICDFAEVRGRDASERLVGHRLAIPVSALPPAGDDFYHHELRGMVVADLDGRVLGRVIGVLDGPAQDLLEVATEGIKETWFVPFVDAIVKQVDRASGRIVVDPPEGLIP